MTYSTTQAGEKNFKEEDFKLVNKIVSELTAAKTAWKSSVVGKPEVYLASYKTQLLNALSETGIGSGEMIALGMERARADEKPFLPSPGQFCKWCQPTPEDYGMPSAFDAFQEALKKSGQHQTVRDPWSHNAVYLAAKNTGFFELNKTG